MVPRMAELIYSVKPTGIPTFLKHIQSAGVPVKVTYNYLKQAGFTSTNDRDLIRVMRGIGFVDQSNVPTPVWKAYRNTSTAKATLATAIRSAYSGLFHLYPEAQNKDDEAIRNWRAALN